MRTRLGLALVALVCSLLLAAAVGSASQLVYSENHFRITYSPMSFIPSFGATIRCPVTIERSFHSRTIGKASGSLIGFTQSFATRTCEAGSWRVHSATLPWHAQWSTFSGSLPLIADVTTAIVGIEFELAAEAFGLRVNCDYRIASTPFIDVRESRGVLTGESPGSEWHASLTAGCPEVRLSGNGSVKTPRGATISVSLI